MSISEKIPCVPKYSVKPTSELTTAERAERKRRLNVLHSRRRRERERVEMQVYVDEADELREKNRKLTEENQRFEAMLSAAQSQISMTGNGQIAFSSMSGGSRLPQGDHPLGRHPILGLRDSEASSSTRSLNFGSDQPSFQSNDSRDHLALNTLTGQPGTVRGVDLSHALALHQQQIRQNQILLAQHQQREDLLALSRLARAEGSAAQGLYNSQLHQSAALSAGAGFASTTSLTQAQQQQLTNDGSGLSTLEKIRRLGFFPGAFSQP